MKQALWTMAFAALLAAGSLGRASAQDAAPAPEKPAGGEAPSSSDSADAPAEGGAALGDEDGEVKDLGSSTGPRAFTGNSSLGSPAGSPFGRIGPYDLSRPSQASLWPQLYAGGGIRHVEVEGGSSRSETFVRLGAAANLWQVAIGLEADLIWDDSRDFATIYFDDPSDYLSIIKYAEYGAAGDTIHLQGGVIADASIGHGTILGHYYNNTVLGKARTGLVAESNLRVLGLQALSNDIIENDVLAGRLSYRPLYDTKIPFIRGLSVSTTVAIDRDAPRRLRVGPAGEFLENGSDELRASSQQVMAYGLDLELPIFQNSWVSLIPYADQNFINDFGSGTHVGASANFNLPLYIPTSLKARAEWRRFSGDYLPTYFDAFYEFERFHYPRTDSATTKFQALQNSKLRDGMLYELAFDFARSLQIGAIYEDNTSHETDRLDLYAAFTGLDWLIIRAHYQRRNFSSASELTTLDGQSFLSAQALVKIWSFIYGDFRWVRQWELDETSGRYRPVDLFQPSLAIIFQF